MFVLRSRARTLHNVRIGPVVNSETSYNFRTLNFIRFFYPRKEDTHEKNDVRCFWIDDVHFAQRAPLLFFSLFSTLERFYNFVRNWLISIRPFQDFGRFHNNQHPTTTTKKQRQKLKSGRKKEAELKWFRSENRCFSIKTASVSVPSKKNINTNSQFRPTDSFFFVAGIYIYYYLCLWMKTQAHRTEIEETWEKNRNTTFFLYWKKWKEEGDDVFTSITQ